jgi:hypothetical protein
MLDLNEDQMLIMINGLINGGKSIVYNLIKKEDDFIYLDISPGHFDLYKDEMINQIGENNVLRIKPFIESKEIALNSHVFTREIGFIMKQFPNYNFVIKPIKDGLSIKHAEKAKDWCSDFKKFIGIKPKNIHFLFIVRHPKLSWLTAIKDCPFDIFLDNWNNAQVDVRKKHTRILKVEAIKHDELLKKIIKKTDLNKVIPYTMFDLKAKIKRNFDNVAEEIEIIERKLKHVYEHLEYDLEDKYSELFMQDRRLSTNYDKM